MFFSINIYSTFEIFLSFPGIFLLENIIESLSSSFIFSILPDAILVKDELGSPCEPELITSKFFLGNFSISLIE